MSALPQSRPKTVDDLIELEASGYQRYEIVDDEFVELEVSADSSETNARFTIAVGIFMRRQPIGRIYDSEMIYDLPKSVRRADVSVLLNHRLPEKDVSRFSGAPDIVVEVVSPSDRTYAASLKVQEWLDAGAQLVWLANPAVREIAVYRRGKARLLTASDTLDGEDVLPGFSEPVASLFPEPRTTPTVETGGQ